jgi:hypothetical protein
LPISSATTSEPSGDSPPDESVARRTSPWRRADSNRRPLRCERESASLTDLRLWAETGADLGILFSVIVADFGGFSGPEQPQSNPVTAAERLSHLRFTLAGPWL